MLKKKKLKKKVNIGLKVLQFNLNMGVDGVTLLSAGGQPAATHHSLGQREQLLIIQLLLEPPPDELLTPHLFCSTGIFKPLQILCYPLAGTVGTISIGCHSWKWSRQCQYGVREGPVAWVSLAGVATPTHHTFTNTVPQQQLFNWPSTRSCVTSRSTKSSRWATPHCQLPNVYCTSLG